MKDEILFLYLNNELDESEKEEVEAWIKSNPQHFNKIKEIWECTAQQNSAVQPNKTKMWSAILSEVQADNGTKKIRKLPSYRSLLKYAAIFLLGLGILGYFARQQMNHVEWISYASAYNDTAHLELPDGSIITLNKASSLQYKKQFLSKTREVILEGEAFFKVQPNPKKPFIISAKGTMVKVLGTSFNIDAGHPSGNVAVSVKSGRVMFYESRSPAKHLQLTAGDLGKYTPEQGTITKGKVEDPNYLAWKTGILLFKNKSLGEVCEVLNAHFNASVKPDNQTLASKRLTARYENKTLPEILELLQITLDINIQYRDNDIWLSSN